MRIVIYSYNNYLLDLDLIKKNENGFRAHRSMTVASVDLGRCITEYPNSIISIICKI